MSFNSEDLRSIREQVAEPLEKRFTDQLAEIRRENRRHVATMARRDRRLARQLGRRLTACEAESRISKSFRGRVRLTYAALALLFGGLASLAAEPIKHFLAFLVS